MHKLKQLYYRSTGLIPRHMPKTQAEFKILKDILMQAFHVADEPICWMTVAGQITSKPAGQITVKYTELANAAKRYFINGIAQDEKISAGNALKAQLEAAIKRQTDLETKPILTDEEVESLSLGMTDPDPQF